MTPLRPATKAILARVEAVTGKPVQFMRDDKLALMATLQMARHGAEFHVLRYQPSNQPLDYLITFQAGFVLRLFENPPDQRFDFSPDDAAAQQVATLMSAGLPQLGTADRQALPGYSRHVAQWALLNLRSLPIGMRIDRWIADTCPELAPLQRASIQLQQQQNLQVLAHRLGKLSVPVSLLGSIAAYALFADRLLGTPDTDTVPYQAMGLQGQAEQLLQILDDTPADARHDVALVDRWAAHCGLNGWYHWIPYRP